MSGWLVDVMQAIRLAIMTLCNWPNLIFWNYNKETIIPCILSLTQYFLWMISIEISQCARSSCRPGNLNRHIRFHFMWKWDCFYVINVSISIPWLNICQSLVMWYLSSGVLCSHHMTRNTLVHICHTLNDTCCIQFRIHSRFHQVYRQLGAGGRLIAITVILPFLMCHRNLQLGDAICTTVGSRLATQLWTQRYHKRWEASCMITCYLRTLSDGTPPDEMCPISHCTVCHRKQWGAFLLDSAISFWPAPSDERIDAYLRKNWHNLSFVIVARLF